MDARRIVLRPLRVPEARVGLYAAALAGIGASLYGLLLREELLFADPVDIWSPPVPLLVFFGAFLATERTALHISVRQQTHTISMTTLPLIYGLMVTDVATVTVARVSAGMGVAIFYRKSAVIKWIWNGALFFTETAVAATVIRFAVGVSPPDNFGEWSMVLLAAMSAEALGFIAVPFVIMLYEWRWRWDLFKGPMVPHALVALANSFAVVAVAASLVDPWLLVFAIVALLGSSFFTKLHSALTRKHSSLERIHDFTKALDEPGSVLEGGLDKLNTTLNSRCAGVLVSDKVGAVTGRIRIDDAEHVIEASLTPAQVGTLGASSATTLELLARSELRRLDTGADAKEQDGDGDNEKDRNKDKELLLASVMGGETELFGLVFAFDKFGPEKFQQDEKTLFDSLARTFGARLANETFVKRLEDQATKDVLTSLTNRRTFEQDLKERLKPGNGGGAVAIIDLDRFKDVNDTLGHAVGDRLLKVVAARVLAVARPADLVARIGGDEMALIIGSATEPAAVEDLLQAVRSAIAEPMAAEGLNVTVGASVGYALWPADGSDDSLLMRRADIAMYEAKRSRQGVVRYEPAFDENTPRRLRLAAELREACERGDLEVLLQPKVRADTLEPTGFEALCRYRVKDRKPNEPERIEPSVLLELAEQGGFLSQLTRTVISITARHAALLKESLIDVPIAVNLAPSDVLDDSVPDHLKAAARAAGVPVTALSCEIDQLTGFGTEDLAASEQVIGRLREMGVSVALDDFGTGAAPLMVLHHIALDEIKLDQQFVADVTRSMVATKLVRSTIELAHELGVRCVAEGVEEIQVMETLQQLGCDELQGNLISHPLPVEEVPAWVVDWDMRRVTMQAAGTLSAGD